MWPTLLLGLGLHGTVDRIEGDVAVVEWVDGSFSDLPLGHLPPGLTEGAHVRVRIRTEHLSQRTRRPRRARRLHQPAETRLALVHGHPRTGPTGPSSTRSTP